MNNPISSGTEVLNPPTSPVPDFSYPEEPTATCAKCGKTKPKAWIYETTGLCVACSRKPNRSTEVVISYGPTQPPAPSIETIRRTHRDAWQAAKIAEASARLRYFKSISHEALIERFTTAVQVPSRFPPEPPPDKATRARRARAARERNAAGRAAPASIRARWEMWGNRCYLCGAPATATDHVIALAAGGSQWPANLRPICKLCNSRKGSMSLSNYLSIYPVTQSPSPRLP